MAAAVGSLAAAGVAAGHRVPGAPKCPVFPASNPWNQRVDRLPVLPNSAKIVDSIGADTGVHPDFGSGLYNGQRIGIPYEVVGRHTRRAKFSFQYADESDRGPYPVGAHPPIEGGSDHHVLMVDRDACKLYEVSGAQQHDGGRRWAGWSGAIWSLRSNKVRPKTWTSADAAGLPIFPGLARYDEVRRGSIDHALRFTVEQTRRAFIYPARHYASTRTDPDLPAMGQRVRLKASFDMSGFPRQSRVVLEALKRYGMIVADNGSNWYISGAPNSHWSNDDLHSLGRVKGSDFEVVDTSKLP
ncbi:MAG: hypothetical protein ACJ768_23550 [Gaiellaceae bacterium]